MKVTYQQVQISYNTVELDAKGFRRYIKQVNIFWDKEPKFFQLMRRGDNGFIRECAVLPLDFIPNWAEIDLDVWFADNYEMVYNHLKQLNTELY